MKNVPGRVVAALTSIALALVALVSISPARAATSSHTLWASDDATQRGVQTRDWPIEVGTRFTSSAAGQVTGITFWKNDQDTGTHVGSLWTADGRRLASLEFTGESATGWQRASFDRPVPIAANTEYVVSYHVPSGHHAYTYRYFRDRDVTSGPLFAPRSGGVKVNGVATYGPAGTFPDGNWEDLNYWVSPVFTTSTPAPSTAQAWVNPNSGNCMDVKAAATADGTTVQTYTCNGTVAQAWAWDGAALKNPSSGKCLDVRSAQTADGTPVQLWTCNGTAAQQWERRGNALVNAGSGKCLDVHGQSRAIEVALQIWTCNGTVAQDWTTTPGTTPTPPPVGTGQFETRGGRIYDPQGREFVGVGANLGLTHTVDWKGTAYGHAKEAKEWGWNIVRLNVLASDVIDYSYVHQRGYDSFVNDLDGVVKEYTDSGIVVVIDAHDLMMNDKNPEKWPTILSQLDRFWGDMATKYKNNPRVWFNLHNEPPIWDPAPWVDLHKRYLGPIRAAGAQNIVVVDAPVWGEDLGPNANQGRPNIKFAYEPDMAPALAKQYGNVVLSMHNYAYDYGTPDLLRAYVGKVRAAGVPLLIGEFSWRLDGLKEWEWNQLNSVDSNKQSANATFAVQKELGLTILWWHGTHGDTRSLKSDYTAFYQHGSGNMLSEPGQKLWALTHQ